jgi:hypothetical protein
MDADFSIELGHEDLVLDFPWTDQAGELAYVDLKRQPELMAKIKETEKFPELAEFLRKVNSARSIVESAKCDVWTTTELNAEEEVFHAAQKFASYVDLVVSDGECRRSFSFHEGFAKKLTELLRRAPEIRAAAEICVRRCFFSGGADTAEGFYFTLYTNGYGEDEAGARKSWAIAMNLVGNAVVQLSANR